MFVTRDVREIEDRRMVDEVMADQMVLASAFPADVKTGKEHAPLEDTNGVGYERCGGGRRRLPHRSQAS